MVRSALGEPSGPEGRADGFALFDRDGSAVSLPATATFPKSDPFPVYPASRRTVNTQDFEAPGANEACGPHVTVCPTAVQPSTEDTNANGTGRASVAFTF